MKLEQILDKLGSIGRNLLIKVIDKIISNNPKTIIESNKISSTQDNCLKQVDNQYEVKIELPQNNIYLFLLDV
ncbi:hypothetical protein [Winogradskyella sp.]|uniref:hypothetical protein n=1 Tax=Winogradskyella sp. TaxID=1883156 RepID=UPI002624B03D|nr:hypothetical protein [Winogradskyella sp.]